MGVTRQLAEFAAEASWQDVDAAVIAHTKRCIVNVVGVAVGAATRSSLHKVVAAEAGKPRATVWGTETRASLQQAALANAWSSHVEDYDDTHFPTVIHPTAPTFPAAFAAGELVYGSGRELVLATAVGLEVCCRVGLAVHPAHYDAGWHITGTCGVFGAAVAAGRILGLDGGQMAQALGIAGTQGAGLRESFGTMAKAMNAGHASQSGMLAALLAREHFSGPATILEGPRGFGAVMSTGSDWSRAVRGLGRKWEVMQIGLKPYPCGVVIHPLIDAAIELHRQGIDSSQIESVEAWVNPLVLELVNRPVPKDELEAKFSYQQGVAIGLLRGAAYPSDYEEVGIDDLVVSALRGRIHAEADGQIEQDATRMTVTMASGEKLSTAVEHAVGSPRNPLDDKVLDEKFIAVSEPSLGISASKRLLEKLRGLEDENSLEDLVSLLRCGA